LIYGKEGKRKITSDSICDYSVKMPTITPDLGDILIDTDYTLMSLGAFDAFKDRNQKLISPLDILALFALSEAIVLHERILTESMSEETLSFYETMPQLVKAGVLNRINRVTDYKQNVPDEFQKQVWTKLERIARGVDEWIGTDFTLSASIARAKWCNGKNVDHLSWPVFGALPGEVIRRDHIINQGYSHVSDLVKQHVFNLRGAGAPIPLYIPPIPAIILQRCGNRADRFFYETLALREEFAIARRKLWAYQKLISNKNGQTLGELSQIYRDAVSDVIAALDHIAAKRTDSSLLLELWDAVCEVKISSSKSDATLETGLNLGTLLTKGFKWLEVRRIRARARLLFDLYQKTLQIKSYGTLIGNVFKTDTRELIRASKKFENLGKSIDQIISVNRSKAWSSPTLD
jgi:hypothetical protein